MKLETCEYSVQGNIAGSYQEGAGIKLPIAVNRRRKCLETSEDCFWILVLLSLCPPSSWLPRRVDHHNCNILFIIRIIVHDPNHPLPHTPQTWYKRIPEKSMFNWAKIVCTGLKAKMCPISPVFFFTNCSGRVLYQNKTICNLLTISWIVETW